MRTRLSDKMYSVMEVFLFLCVSINCVTSVPLRLFYPYGASRGDTSLRSEDDVSSPEIQLETPVHFYDGFYTSLFVNSNGHLSFESELPGYQPTMVMPLGIEVKIIAAFMADLDLSVGGNVFYRETTEEALLQRVAADIQGHFSQFTSFEPLGLFIATWDKAPAFRGDTKSVNTFQIVIASDELNSFVIMNYLDDGVQWIQSGGKFAGVRDDPPAQAGFDSGSANIHLQLPKSGTTRVQELAFESNVNIPGVWMYHIGNTKGSNVQPPDLNTGDVMIFEPELDKPTCQDGARQCHSDAICVDYANGFCCSCVAPAFGNGKHCITTEQPQRLNGKVSGTLNGVSFENLDMHAFVVTKDGRAYTAISRVPDEISSGLMTLNTIGGVVGWLFALQGGPGARNGYMFTGGLFNRTARIRYQQGEEVVIEQKYHGNNVLNNIRMETVINGNVPSLASAEKITIDDYSEEYRRASPGVIRSSSDRTFHVNNVASRYTWDQVINYEECAFDPTKDQQDSQRLSVTRNFVIYDPNDKVVRFAMSNKIQRRTGTDPCEEGAKNCDENADCIPQAESYICDCKTGFVGDGRTCIDVDECDLRLDTCAENAICSNSPGSFQCQCDHGYRGDGITCTREDVRQCGDETCDDNARCVFNSVEQKPMCECLSGFRRDEYGRCRPIPFACNEVDICHENAECVYNDIEERYNCECTEGFSGDGLFCESSEIGQCDCDPNADCVIDPDRMIYRCVCKEGYTGDGRYCNEIRDISRVCDDCHPNAVCRYDQSEGRYGCVCSAGYQGDGTRCVPYDCRDADICDANARCAEDSYGNYVCFCNSGYRGDGRRCIAEGCNVLNNCDVNAQCLPDPRDTSRYMCRCNPGYSGDGQVCIRRVIPCNEVDNCSEQGQCLYDPASQEYRCRCNRGYDGDGITCRPRGVDCRRDTRYCDPNAACLLNVDTFVCVCNQGYRGDGRTCQPMRDEMNYLLFSRGYSIHKVAYQQNGEDSDGSRVLYVPDELAVGVASDCVDQTFYWTDVSRGRISRANLQGFDKELVTAGFNSPEGIAIDWIARNIYVTDSGLDIIAVISINGTNRKTLISDGVINPRAIILDPSRGVMYWTDWYRNNPTIERANMDGTDREVFVDTDLGLPNGLTIDYYTQQICWGDAGVNRIECIRSDGIGRRVITEDAPYPFDLTFYGNTIYWSDWTINGVPSVHRDGGEKGEPLTLPVGGNGRLYGISAVGEFCPRVTNACLRQNGGCRYLCLPTPNGGRTCACPDDVDDITCSEIGIITKK
ncbi:nidogen-1-like [Mercenaria mercenaria]|uniref:nidogen-1-like n=1 Tax=Mercenaria mercenaria TaxID=6596 RepID=UPI00234EB3C1|nr:nidogen-1-like [Mercenaria mercenaria]